ncbi:hypothetical protein AAC387_Pa05g1009 [Persea americana]
MESLRATYRGEEDNSSETNDSQSNPHQNPHPIPTHNSENGPKQEEFKEAKEMATTKTKQTTHVEKKTTNPNLRNPQISPPNPHPTRPTTTSPPLPERNRSPSPSSPPPPLPSPPQNPAPGQCRY